MSVAKAAVLGLVITVWVCSSARADPMLFLGTFSNQPSSVSFSPTISAPAPDRPFTGAGSLRLGLSDDPAISNAPAALPVPAANVPPASSTGIAARQFGAIAPPQGPPVAIPPSGVYDAFINLGGGPYPNVGSLTTGTATPWFTSQPVQNLFGGVPTPQQRADFDNTVIQRVGLTFRQSGINLSLTGDPDATAAHTVSVVANTANPASGQAIGMTYLGGNGFHFIDQSAKSAHSVDQLGWIVAHNVAHELMLAFGVPEIHDTTGQFVDARSANWGMMIDPSARFSPEAAQDLLSRNFQGTGSPPVLMGAQFIETPPVPEPSTVAVWLLGGSALLIGRRLRSAARGTLRP